MTVTQKNPSLVKIDIELNAWIQKDMILFNGHQALFIKNNLLDEIQKYVMQQVSKHAEIKTGCFECRWLFDDNLCSFNKA